MEEHNNIVYNLWNNNHGIPDTYLSPAVYGEKREGALLFIGLNPSFSQNGFNRLLINTEFEHILDDLEGYFSFQQYHENRDGYIQIDELAEQNYQYFSRFNNLCEGIDLCWEHIDLLYTRNTNQQDVVNLRRNHPDFFNAQVARTVQLISDLKPRLIVVQNAFASSLLELALSLVWQNNWGTYANEENVPVFLSGMFTGRRALDNESFRRLKWHIEYVLSLLQ